MDSPDRQHRLLGAFLAGELDATGARRWDEHLLECEQCWQAVREDRASRQAAQLLRQPAPPGLADRVAFAVEVAAAGRAATQRRARPGTRSPRRARRGTRSSRLARPDRWLLQGLAGAAALAVGLAVTLVVLLLPGGRAVVPAAVAAVARYAQAVPPPARDQHPGARVAPVEVGRPVIVTAGGQRIVMRTWRLGATEAVVAVSGQPFPMPDRAQAVPGGGMAWSARLGKLGLYCLNGRRSELVAAPVQAAELAGLAARLPLA
jgi:anti-sigma factor RsiW